MSTCQLVCPLKCGTKIKSRGIDGMKRHFEEDCPLAEFLCLRCDKRMERKELDDHDCLSTTLANN